MTDLEIVQKCAEAMGLACYVDSYGDLCLPDVDHDGDNYIYNPLHDDAQAMALLYWLSFECEIIVSSGEFHCNSEEHKMEEIYGITSNADLNRAICECVAKMQAAK